MSNEDNVTKKEGSGRPGKGEIYQIRIKGHLDSQWSEWFNGFAISHQDDGTTVLIGPIADQPALHGLLVKIRNPLTGRRPAKIVRDPPRHPCMDHCAHDTVAVRYRRDTGDPAQNRRIAILPDRRLSRVRPVS